MLTCLWPLRTFPMYSSISMVLLVVASIRVGAGMSVGMGLVPEIYRVENCSHSWEWCRKSSGSLESFIPFWHSCPALVALCAGGFPFEWTHP